MSWSGRFDGLIRVGDKFTWTPYGHPGSSGRTWCRIEVTDITLHPNGDRFVWTVRYVNGDALDDAVFNDEEHFREMVGEHDPVIRHDKYSVSRITSDNPRVRQSAT